MNGSPPVAAVTATAPSEAVPTETRVELPGVTIEVLEAAAAPGMEAAAPLVFLHEGLGSARLWRSFPWVLATVTGRRTIAYSRPGYGRSSVVTAPLAPGYMHDEALAVLPEVLARMRIERPVLVGHSDGASIALIHAGALIESGAGHPVTAVVAIAPHVMVEERSLEGIRAARDRFATTDLADRMARHHTDPVATFRGWNDIWLSEPFRDWNIEDHLPAITAPVLVIQAGDDEYGTLDQVGRITAAVSGPAEALVLPHGGHAPHMTRPAEVRSALAAFVSRLP